MSYFDHNSNLRHKGGELIRHKSTQRYLTKDDFFNYYTLMMVP